jgi:uncharacterized membrane protein
MAVRRCLTGEEVIHMAALRSGLDKNTAAAFSYILFFVSGIGFYILEKDPFVRFHSLQSVIVFVTLFLLSFIVGLFRQYFNLDLTPLISIAVFTLWLILIYKAWQGEEWEVPVLGKFARKFAKQT